MTQPADSSDEQNHIEKTVFTDAQFSSGVAPPSYVTASDYKTIQVNSNSTTVHAYTRISYITLGQFIFSVFFYHSVFSLTSDF